MAWQFAPWQGEGGGHTEKQCSVIRRVEAARCAQVPVPREANLFGPVRKRVGRRLSDCLPRIVAG